MAQKKFDPMLGISVEHNILSLTLMKGGSIKKSIWKDIPDNIVQQGEIVSQNLFIAFLKDAIKENNMTCKNAAYVISSGDIFIRNITIPRMDEEQVKYNVPFEFRDYIRGELKEYIFDYAYRPPLTAEEEAATTINLLAVAMPRTALEVTKSIVKSAGMKLVKAIPEVCVFESLLGLYPTPEEQDKERCFIDIGNTVTRMLIYKNKRYKLVHNVDIGERRVVQVIADELNADMHLAQTYLRTDYQECTKLPAVMNAYKDISIEVLKGLNFYEMSDMTARLRDVVLCGRGSLTAPLVDILKERITMDVVTMEEAFTQYAGDGAINVTAQSLGALL